MSKTLPLTVKAGLFCDDVRAERSGKFIVIGTYAQNIGVPAFPVTLVLNCLLILEAAHAGEANLEFRLLCDANPVRTGKGRAKFGKGTLLLPIPNLVLQDLKKETIVALQIRQDGGEWTPVCSVPLEKAPSN